MKSLILDAFREYLLVNNPDLVVALQDPANLEQYTEDKYAAIIPMVDELLASSVAPDSILAQCMDALTVDLRPSRFNYLKEVLEEEFPIEYELFTRAGIVLYEIINLLELCKEDFDLNHFGEGNEDARYLRYAIIAIVHDYLS